VPAPGVVINPNFTIDKKPPSASPPAVGTGACDGACGATGFTDNCASIASGQQEAACQSKTADTMVSSCVGTSTFAMKCSDSGAGGMPPFLNEQVLQCKVCKATSGVADSNPVANKVVFSFFFGDMFNHETGSLVTNVAFYEVFQTDHHGLPLKRLSQYPARSFPSSQTCCREEQYKVSIEMDIDGTYDGQRRLAIRPVSTSGNTLPFIWYSDLLADATVGEVAEVTGNIVVQMDTADITKYRNDPEAAQAVFSKSIASVVAGVDALMVMINRIIANGVLIFGTNVAVSGRRLATADVQVDYTILSTDTNLEVATMDTAALATAIQTESAAAGIQISAVTVTSASDPQKTTIGSAPKAQSDHTPGRVICIFATLLALGAHLLH
jgi:hypothetical protein